MFFNENKNVKCKSMFKMVVKGLKKCKKKSFFNVKKMLFLFNEKK